MLAVKLEYRYILEGAMLAHPVSLNVHLGLAKHRVASRWREPIHRLHDNHHSLPPILSTSILEAQQNFTCLSTTHEIPGGNDAIFLTSERPVVPAARKNLLSYDSRFLGRSLLLERSLLLFEEKEFLDGQQIGRHIRR